MKERPILFSAPMVRAILAGAKTQTRRVVKPQFKADAVPAEMGLTNDRGHQISGHSGVWWCDADGNEEESVRCPYGQPGDQLWVRETWGIAGDMPHDAGYLEYRASCNGNFNAEGDLIPRWRPSIHMPRWASRIQLEITGVRVERLQDISMEDCKAEGAWGPDDSIVSKVQDYFNVDVFGANPKLAYRMLWEQINGPGSWDVNPWVWVIEFKRITKGTP